MGTQTYAYTGDWQRFDVPKNVKEVRVTLEGGGSGTTSAGRVTGRLKVNDKQFLYVLVGGQGRSPSGSTGGAASVGGGGAGGNGHTGAPGWGGGGASALRVGSATGAIRAVAGGAGGASGDGGTGGQGGTTVGENGFPGTGAPAPVGNATGGTQIQGGNGGTSGSGDAYAGGNAPDTALGKAGAGGSPDLSNIIGGGGGGGGFRAGGGGQAGLIDVSVAGGGGGGSNYVGGIFDTTNTRTGGTGHGSVTITWTNPPPANQPPSPPTLVKVGGQDAVDEQVTRSVGGVTITAKIDDPNAGQKVRLVATWSATKDFSAGVKTVTSPPVAQAKRATVHLTGLSQDTHYYVRLHTRDSHNRLSVNYTSINFWSNRKPSEPELVAPVDGATVAQLSSVVFQWNHVDLDPNSVQRAYELRWRLAASPTVTPGVWHTEAFTTSFNQFVANPGTFKANLVYEWQVRTQDQQNAWGPWGPTVSFFVSGEALAPLLLSPVGGEAIDVTVPVEFNWLFRDPDQGDHQTEADLRWRVVGTPDWITRIGSTTTPGSTQAWVFDPYVFQPGFHYEYQVRTTDNLSAATSDWSESEDFWGTSTPGAAVADALLPSVTVTREALGVGHHRVWVFDRGGKYMRGEITPLATITWNRKRDDIGSVVVDTNGLGDDRGAFLSTIHTWRHEIVVFRDGIRVFEGPITRITDNNTSMEFEAKDVMAYAYRRIMRRGYNDSYRVINGVVQGDFTVVERAAKIIVDALAPDDPNVLPYLTLFTFPDDAGQSRIVPDYTKTAWEEVDDMAQTAGLDYTTIGRRITLWDTHRAIGKLPELRTENFSDPPVITEYGMQFANHFGVTNGSGLFGSADRPIGPEGLIELLASAYGETDASANEVLTAAAREELQRTLSSQAERNMGSRNPVPVIVRVPDNSTLDPSTNLGINDLIPGVWVPLRAKGGCMNIAQWQKLDLVTVTEDDKGERVQVTMSPAPNHGLDPDAEGTEEDE